MKNIEFTDISRKPLTAAMEDYLEVIFNISKEKRVVRVKDIAHRLEVKMPTVTNMLKTLSKRGLIDYKKYEYLELTDKGSKIGNEINQRHIVLRTFLTDILKIDLKQADGEACKMEHAISALTLNRFIEFMEFIQSCPRAGVSWLDYFDEYRLYGKNKEKCREYMKEFNIKFKKKINDIGIMEDKNNGA